MTVLMLGQHLELGNYRVEFLKSHGVSVIFPTTREAALEAIQAGGYDSVILSYSLSNQTATELMELVRQVCPDCALICITEQRWDDANSNPMQLCWPVIRHNPC